MQSEAKGLPSKIPCLLLPVHSNLGTMTDLSFNVLVLSYSFQ